MKVILLQDIARTGRKHEVKEVPDGHAHNYLIPRKLALSATPQNLKYHSEHRARMEAQTTKAAAAFAKVLEDVRTAPVVMTVPANEQGNLFKGLRATDIASAIAAATGVTIPASAIELRQPIKEVGEHFVPLTVGGRQENILISVRAK
jgi:large subunit ribosomal protein L9